MVQIITDTTACLPAGFGREYNIPIIPQIINFGNDSYYEGSEMDNAAFMARLVQEDQLPKTAAPPPELFSIEFQRMVPLGEPILCIHPSADVSGTVRSATIAKQDFPNADIRVLDTRTIGSALMILVKLAAEWAAAGLDADSIMTRLEAMVPRCRLYFLVATLDYLARGGRIGGASAFLGSMLQIKPILALQDGHVEPYERERTQKRAVARLKALVIEQFPRRSPGYLTVMHAGVPDQAQALAEDLCAMVGVDDIPIVDVPPAIVTHGGPGILAVSFFVD